MSYGPRSSEQKSCRELTIYLMDAANLRPAPFLEINGAQNLSIFFLLLTQLLPSLDPLFTPASFGSGGATPPLPTLISPPISPRLTSQRPRHLHRPTGGLLPPGSGGAGRRLRSPAVSTTTTTGPPASPKTPSRAENHKSPTPNPKPKPQNPNLAMTGCCLWRKLAPASTASFPAPAAPAASAAALHHGQHESVAGARPRLRRLPPGYGGSPLPPPPPSIAADTNPMGNNQPEPWI
ncbi:unnamed protein product [Urochloa humidicola]